ncbi:DUF4132 domain-containing protein [Actinoplanes couchii]|nr:DUF4132 domain-containing protein [Actinoplanes couchii]MDR6320952.1 hypothetical protein [Actinoplanes couchii]
MTAPWPEPPAAAAEDLGRRFALPAYGKDPDAEFDPVRHARAVDSAAAWSGGGDLDPRDAAAAVLLLGGEIGTLPAEAWVQRSGVVFAARAVAEMPTMIFNPLRRDETLYLRSRSVDGLQDWWASHWNPERTRMVADEDVLVSAAMTIRARLAAAAAEEHAAALAALDEYREGPLPQRIITSFLAPERSDWIDADIAGMVEWFGQFTIDHRRLGLEGRLHTLLVLAAADPRQFCALDQALDASPVRLHDQWIPRERMLGTAADVLGDDMMKILDQRRYGDVAGIRMGHAGLGDEALAVLMSIPSDAAMRRIVTGTLDTYLSDFARCGALIRQPERALRVLADAERSRNPDGWLPSIYRDVIATVVDTVPGAEEALGDRSGLGRGLAARLDMADRHSTVFARAADRKQAVTWLAAIRTDETLGLLAERADQKYVAPILLKVITKDPARALRVLAGWEADDEHRGEVVADVLRNLVLDHVAAARAFLDEGEPSSPAARQRIERILTAVEAAAAVPVAAEASLPAVLRSGAKTKRLPGWLVVGALPGVRVRGSEAVLPESAVRQLIDLVARSTFAVPHPGLDDVRAACERADLAGFAWAIFEQWRGADHPSGDKQAMLALGLLGDDTTVPAVSALFGEWAFGAAGRVRTGIEVLGAIGTDVALTHLRRVARKAKQKGFRKLAEEKLDRIAEVRGLSPAELADRIVPDLDLGTDGRLLLDYGPRRLVITFDQWLTPQISEESGRVLKRLPKPAAADDAVKAAEAQASYTTLKRELKDVAAERLRALEEAMLTERAWGADDFRALIRDHPLVRHIARGLIWQVVDGPSFRIAEDRTLAGVDDTTLTLESSAVVRLYHPATGDPAATATWVGTLEDYETSQPFPQLAREVHRFTAEQTGVAQIDDFAGSVVGSGLLYALVSRGWRFGEWHGSVVRDWPGGQVVTVDFEPPFDPMGYDSSEPRKLGSAVLSSPPEATFGELGPLAASETLRDLHRLAAG